MAWQDIANQLLGAQAPAVIQYLSQVDPNYDWTAGLQANAAANQGNSEWLSPSNTGAAGIAEGTIDYAAQANPQVWANPAFVSGRASLDQARQGQASTIQAEQATHGGGGLGGLGGLLAIGGLALGGAGLAGIGPLAGLFGGGSGLLDAGAMAGLSADATAGLAGMGELSQVPALAGLSAAPAAAGTGAATMSGTDLSSLFDPSMFSNAGTSAIDFTSGFGGPTAGAAAFGDPNFFDPSMFTNTGTSGIDFTSGFGGSGLSLSDLTNLSKLIPGGSAGGGLSQLLFGSGGGGLSNLFGSRGLVGTAAAEVPGLLALNYAGSQPGLNTAPLQGVLDQLGGNTNAVVKAATDPVNMNIAAGYGDLVQRLGNRGVLGSSFGNTDIGNYLATTGRTLGNVGATAEQQALGLQGNLAGQLAQLQLQQQNLKNSLYGRGFDILGRGLNPTAYSGLGFGATTG